MLLKKIKEVIIRYFDYKSYIYINIYFIDYYKLKFIINITIIIKITF